MARSTNAHDQARKASIDSARAIRALSCLKNLLSVARQQIDPVTWSEKGGPDAEELVDSLEHGWQHPALQEWVKRKSDNHSAPTRHELHIRRLIASLCLCLEKIGKSKRQAHRLAAEGLQCVLPGIKKNSIDHWARNNQVIDKVVDSALRGRGSPPDEVVKYFVGLIGLLRDPSTLAFRDGNEVVIVTSSQMKQRKRP